MDAESPYPSAKRRRTSSSASSSSSARSLVTASSRIHDPPYTRSPSQSHLHSHSRSPPPDRHRSRSLTGSSAYSSGDYSRSPSHSPSAVDTTTGDGGTVFAAAAPPRTLRYVPLTTLSRAHARGITCAKFSPDYRLLATGSADATINIYAVPPLASSSPVDPSAFKLLRTLRAHLAGINALAWSPSGPPTTYTLASASDDKSILLWSPLSSDFPISPSPLTGHSNYVHSLAFSPKGNMLVSGSFDEAVFLWDVRSGRIMRQLPAHSDPVRGVDFIHDGTMMCSCSTDGLIRIWDAGTGQCLRTLVDEDRKGVTGVRWSPNGRYVLGWTLDSCVRLWDYVGGRCVKTYMGHVNKEFSLGGTIGTYLAPSPSVPDADADADEDENERDPEHEDEQQQQQQQQHFQEYGFVVSGSENGDILVWDVSTKELLWQQTNAHSDVVLSVDCGKTADGLRGLLVSAGSDRNVRIWIEDLDVPDDQAKRQIVVARGLKDSRGRQQQQQQQQRGRRWSRRSRSSSSSSTQGERRPEMQEHVDMSDDAGVPAVAAVAAVAAAMEEDEEQIRRMEES